MSNDYLEFKEHLEHAFTQADRAKEYKKQSQESVRRQYEDVNGTVQRLKDAAVKDIMFYIKDYNNIIERDRQKLVKAKNMLNSPAGTQAKSSYVKTNSGQSSIREEIKVIEYWMNKNIEKKEELEKKLQEIKSDNTGKKAKAYVDGHKNDLHHSGLIEHASKAGMPTAIKKDQQAQIRKEVIKKIDAYLNSSKFGNVTAEYLLKGGPEMRNKRGGGATADREMRKAANKGAAADNTAKKNTYADMISYISNISGSASNRGLFTSDEIKLIYKLREANYGNASNIAEKLKDSLSNSIGHSDLEHGWFTDLFKKKPTYTATGSTAGMPTNLPSNVGKVSVGTKQSAYTDQVRRLSASLTEYEIKMNQAKANYEQYRKLYNDTKKQLSAAERSLAEATKNAATSGYDSSKSSVASAPRRITSSTTKLYRESKGSTAGAPSYVKRNK